MNFTTELLVQLSICLVMFVVMVYALWTSSMRSVGLPLAFLLSLAMIHWVGGFIHTLPWFDSTYSSAVVAFGFQECFVSMLAFASGSLIAAPLVFKRVRWFQPPGKPALPQLPLALFYMALGLFCVGVLFPLVRAIPSFGALAVCGAYLTVSGLCLSCWQSWVARNRLRLALKLSLCASFPVFTLITLGFIGYGTVAALIVFMFVFSFFRPRWLAVLGLLGAFYFGLSLFVTYMRDRDALREMVRVQESYSDRINAFGEMVGNFEWIDWHNEQHLVSIDDRLNQNFLVGAAKVNLLLGAVPFARGKTLWEAVLALVPRIFWPGKTVRSGSPDIVEDFTGIPFEEGTSIGVGQVMEFYINFGRIGVLVGFFVIGLVVRIMDGMAAQFLYCQDWRGFTTWFLPGLGFLQTGGSLVEVSGTVAASLVLVIGLNKLLLPLLISKMGLAPSSASRKPVEWQA